MAGNTLMSLLVKLGLDSADFDSGMDKAEGKAKSTANNIVGGLASVGAGVAGALAGVAVAGGAFIASTIGPASDLNEIISKTQVVFGDSSAAVLAFGENAATALGMSQNAALSGAATYGNLFRAMQIGEKASADMSTSLVTLAGDLASFNNMDPTEVMNALRAGLSGETEPLKRLGININQALIEQKALSAGLWDGVTPITAAAKAQAVYALAMEQTTLAQGDFARTSDGVANQQRILAATFEDVKAKIGTALLPALTALSLALLKLIDSPAFMAMIDGLVNGLTTLSNWVVENSPSIISGFENIVKWLQDNQPIVVAILVTLGIALLVFAGQAVIAGLTAAAGMLPLILTLAIVAVAVYLLYRAWTENWGGIQEIMKNAGDTLYKIFYIIGWYIAETINVLRNAWVAFNQLGYIIGWVIATAITPMKNNFLLLIAALVNVYNWINGKLIGAFNRIQGAIQGVRNWVNWLQQSFNSLSIPAWLTPGSPTPLELGLLGINAAMKKVAHGGLPSLSMGIDGVPTPNIAVPTGSGVSQASGSSNQPVIDYDRLAKANAYAVRDALLAMGR